MRKENLLAMRFFLVITVVGIVFTRFEQAFAHPDNLCCTGPGNSCSSDGAIQGSIGTPGGAVQNCSGVLKIAVNRLGSFPVTGKSDTDCMTCGGVGSSPSDDVDANWTATAGSPLSADAVDTFNWTAPCIPQNVTIGLTLNDHGHYASDPDKIDSKSVEVAVPTSENTNWYQHVFDFDPPCPYHHIGDIFSHTVNPNCPNWTSVIVNEDMFPGTNNCGLTQGQMNQICAGNSNWTLSETTRGLDQHSSKWCGTGRPCPCVVTCTQKMRVVCSSYSSEGSGPYYATHVITRNVTSRDEFCDVNVAKSGASHP